MLATYGSLLVILAASCLVGQALFALCGRREWSWLAPAVGLGVLTVVAWTTARLPGEAVASLVAVGVLAGGSLFIVADRVTGLGRAVTIGIPVAGATLLAASAPFLVEGRFGILGTGLNPDMSQHLFAADRLAEGTGGRLLDQGYPLGPHALVLVAHEATGASLVHAFGGLTLATPVIAALASLALLEGLAAWRRLCGALAVALPYLAASYLVQGAFKETMEALFVLAFAIGLHELARGALGRRGEASSALVAIPLAVLATGAAYSYSFPGLLWPAGAAGLWAFVELARTARRDSPAVALALVRRAMPATVVALAALAVAVAPELRRMIDFASFETFDPSGPGLGNLFNPISPLEALGVWPSGDFRLDPGDGAMPAAGFYLGEVLGLAALGYGLAWWLRRGERAVPAALAAAAVLFAYAHFSGTPYQAAKAIVIASPLAMLIAARALLSPEPLLDLGGLRGAVARRRGGFTGVVVRRHGLLRTGLAMAFLSAAAASSALALVNGPVGPATYSPALTQLRPALGGGSTLVLAPRRLLSEEHGRDYLVWELRGGRVCVAAADAFSRSSRPPPGISQVITLGTTTGAPFANVRLARRANSYAVWETEPPPRGHGPCDLISVGGRADPDR